MCHRVEAKLSDGDVTGAVRLASSNDTLAPFDDETLSGLQSKHPPTPPDLEFLIHLMIPVKFCQFRVQLLLSVVLKLALQVA